MSHPSRLTHYKSNSFKAELFAHCGKIFIAENTMPPHNDLREFICMGGGKVTFLLSFLLFTQAMVQFDLV